MITMNKNDMTGKNGVNSLLFSSVIIVILSTCTSICLMQILVNNLILNYLKMQ